MRLSYIIYFCLVSVLSLYCTAPVSGAHLNVYSDSLNIGIDGSMSKNKNSSEEDSPVNYSINSTTCNNNGTPCDASDDLLCVTFTVYEAGNYEVGWKDCANSSAPALNLATMYLSSGQSSSACISISTAATTNCGGGTLALFWIAKLDPTNSFPEKASDDFVTIPATCSNGTTPSAPSVTNGSGCENQNITLSANCSSNTAQWYTSSSGGTAFHTGSSYTTTYSSSGSYTYYVSCKTSAGCESSTRTAVTATVNTAPSNPSTTDGSRCGAGIVSLYASGCSGGTLRWFNAPSGGTQVATGTSYSPNLSVTTNYYVECVIGGCTSAREPVTGYIYPNPTTPSVTNGNGCSGNYITLYANCTSGNTVNWYYASSGGTPFHTGTSYGDYFSNTTTYYVSCYNSSTGCESSRVAVTATVNAAPSIPSTTDGSRCGAGIVSLYASGCSGGTLRWFNAPSGGTQVATGTNYSPNLSVTTNYYVECVIGSCTSARELVTGYIYPNPTPPSVTNGSGCVNSYITLYANCSSGNTVNWYYASSGGTPFYTGSSYGTTYYASGSNTYYVSCYNSSTGCESSRVAVTATVSSSPTVSISGTSAICSGGSSTLTASTTAGCGSINSYQWYRNGSFLSGATGSTYSATVAGNYTVYVTNTCGCNATSSGFSVSISSNPTVSISGTSAICSGSSSTLTASTTAGCGSINSYQWYRDGSFLSGATGSTYSATVAGNYTVYVTNTCGCNATSSGFSVSISSNPTVSISGTSAICSGGSSTLTASTTAGCGSINSYQWYRNGSFLSGATGSTYSATVAGNYTVYVTNTCGCNATSSGFSVSISSNPTVSISGTSTICSGGSSTLTASTTAGCGSINSYQWYRNGSFLSGATGSTYSATVAGNYTVYVTNTCGCNATSSGFSVSVNISPTVSISGTSAICSGFSSTLTASTTAGCGSINSYQWYRDGSFLSGATGSTYNTTVAGNYTVYVTNTCGCNATSSGFSVSVSSNPTVSISGTNLICSGGSSTLTANTTAGCGSISNYQWYRDGSLLSGATSATYGAGIAGNYTVMVTNSCGCQATSGILALTVVPDPSVSISGGTTICSGGTANLSATVSNGTGTISYQWQSSPNNSTWTNISGAISSAYTTPALTATTYYRVVVNQTGIGCDAATSASATVTVVADPSVSVSGGTTICSGGTANLSATVSNGTGTISYQWQSSPNNSTWTNIAGATASAYTTPALTATTYYRIVVNQTGIGCDAATSASATVTVVADPSVSVSGGTTICNGGTANLSATVSNGTGTISYQWQSSPNNSTWTNISGATASAYTTPALTTTTYYRVVVNQTGIGCDAVTSASATVTVVADPSVSVSGGTTICSGGTANLSATVSNGTGTISYQWQSSPNNSTWTNISGATASAYTTPALTATTYYRVVVNQTGIGCDAATSASATVTVVADPSVSVSGGTTICSGGTANLSATVSNGTGTISYQWQSSPNNSTWTNISGATASAYTTPALTTTTYYRVVVNQTGIGCDAVTSASATVTVVATPSVSVSGGTTVCRGGTATLTSTVSNGTGTTTYQWQQSTDNITFTNIGGATSSAYTTGALTTTRYYQVIINQSGSGCGSVTSASATVTVVPDPTISITGQGTFCIGAAINLTSTVSDGIGSPTYQWQSSPDNITFTNIAGATTANYMPSTAAVLDMYYRVILTMSGAGCGLDTATARRVIIVPDPTVSVTGGGTTICSGGTANLSATVTNGTGTISYQWQSSPDNVTFTDIVGATTAPYTTAALTVTTYYRIIVTRAGGGCDVITSATATVTVVSDPTVTSSVNNASVCVGGTATLTATVSNGTGTIGYQWQSSTDNVTFVNISGATASTYAAPTSLVGVIYYRVNITQTGNGCGGATSNSTSVTVVGDPQPPSISNFTECVGGVLQLNAATTGGTPALTYQWQSSTDNITFANIAGATAAVYQPSSAVAGVTYFRILVGAVGSGCDAAPPQTATVTIVTDPTISAQPTNLTECVGGTAAISVTVTSGTGTTTYQWQSSTDNLTFSNISGATSATYTPPSVSAGITYYRVNISQSGSGCGALTSATSTVTIITDPSSSVSLPTTTICVGGTTTMTTTITNGVGCSPQWQNSTDNGTTWNDISGATSTSYATPNLSIQTKYRVKLVCTGNGCCN